MNVEELSTLISTVGFPIVCVFAMFFMWNKEREEHKQECDKWCDAINQNTKAITELVTYIKEHG